jgi:hypothetical protein
MYSRAKTKNPEELQKVKKRVPELTAKDLKEDTSIRMVFVTASPVLTNEVKTYYHSLKKKLADHL